MKLAKRVESLPPYLFTEISKKIAAKRAAGVDIITFAIGDPDLPTPKHILDRLHTEADRPQNHQYPESEGLPELRQSISDWYERVTEALCELDFDFIWAADDIAFHTAPFFSPRVYREVLLPHTRKVAERITLPWIYHSDGNLLPIWDDLTSQGMNAIHPLEAGSMDVEMLKAEYGDEIAFVGGVDLRILEAGTPEETREEVVRLIRILGPNYGYLLSASNSITPYVKPENLAAMIETLLEYGRYPLKV